MCGIQVLGFSSFMQAKRLNAIIYNNYGTVYIQRPTCEVDSETFFVNLYASTRTHT